MVLLQIKSSDAFLYINQWDDLFSDGPLYPACYLLYLFGYTKQNHSYLFVNKAQEFMQGFNMSQWFCCEGP